MCVLSASQGFYTILRHPGSGAITALILKIRPKTWSLFGVGFPRMCAFVFSLPRRANFEGWMLRVTYRYLTVTWLTFITSNTSIETLTNRFGHWRITSTHNDTPTKCITTSLTLGLDGLHALILSSRTHSAYNKLHMLRGFDHKPGRWHTTCCISWVVRGWIKLRSTLLSTERLTL